MKIESKYNIGTHIWVVYENNGEIHVYDDYIYSITYEKELGLRYIIREGWDDFKEEDIILYEDEKGLSKKIAELMKKIRTKEVL